MQKMRVVKIGELKPYANNAKVHPEHQIESLVKSIKEFGFVNPILVDESNNVLAGHGRLEAAHRMNMEDVPVVIAEGLSEEQKRAYIIADNRLAEMAEWDSTNVAEELLKLQEEELDPDITGFYVSDFDFSFLDNNEKKEAQENETMASGICECPRCKCLFDKAEIVKHGTAFGDEE